MSRVGKKPIPIPDKVQITLTAGHLTVKGGKGTLERDLHEAVDLTIGDHVVTVTTTSEDRKSRALQGLTRSLVDNMVTGVHQGFVRVLEINGIGYRAEVKGNTLVLSLGYSNPVSFPLPPGISASVEKNTLVKLAGIDKEQLGQTAASIRSLRPPEPYKGKGIKYAEERIMRKAGKTGSK
jgi:large subunit ribosomal protein L6